MTLSCNIDSLVRQHIPHKVAHVGKEVIRNFPHTKRVGNYLLGRTLGEGSFAKVKEGLHTPTGEKVAVKVIDKKKARVDMYVRRNLRREAKLLQLIRHEHVVQLYEVMETKNSYYLVTELCQGGDLMDRINSNRRLDEAETKRLIRQIISAVDHIHKAGILHRDLKIENLLLDENKNIKIIDFGLSNYLHGSPVAADSHMRGMCSTQCGSPAYAAPELLANNKYGAPVDVWSIGINMYAMLTGHLPFTVEPFSIKALHEKMVKGDMNTPPDDVSNDCLDFLRRLLMANPERRMNLSQAMKHDWLLDENHTTLDGDKPSTNCEKLDGLSKLSDDILKHMTQHLGYRMNDAVVMVTSNIPNEATATYHLLLKRLRRHTEQMARNRSLSTAKKDMSRANKLSVTTLPKDLIKSCDKKDKRSSISVRRKTTISKLNARTRYSTGQVTPLAKRKLTSPVKTENQRPLKTAETQAKNLSQSSLATSKQTHETAPQVAPRTDDVILFRLAAASPTKNNCFEKGDHKDSVPNDPSTNSSTTHTNTNIISSESNIEKGDMTSNADVDILSPRLPCTVDRRNTNNVSPRVVEHRGAPYKMSPPTSLHNDVKQCFSTAEPNQCRFPVQVTRRSVARANGANKCIPEYAHYEKFGRRHSNIFPVVSKCENNKTLNFVYPTDSKTSPNQTHCRSFKTGVSRSLSFRDKYRHTPRRTKLPRRQSIEITTPAQSNKTALKTDSACAQLDNDRSNKIELCDNTASARTRKIALPAIAAMPVSTIHNSLIDSTHTITQQLT